MEDDDIGHLFASLEASRVMETYAFKTADVVYQDFYAALYLKGLETILAGEVNAFLAEKILNIPNKSIMPSLAMPSRTKHLNCWLLIWIAQR